MNTFLKSFRVKNFKAIKDSGAVKLTPLTVFIGNNGSGKSSLIEALQTVQDIVDHGLDSAMQNWLGFEHVWHKGVPHRVSPKELESEDERIAQSNPMIFELRGKATESYQNFAAKSEISLDKSGDELFFVSEELTVKDWKYARDKIGKTEAHYTGKEQLNLPEGTKIQPLILRDWGGTATFTVSEELSDDVSLLQDALGWYISEWQFLSIAPQEMGRPNPQQRTGGRVYLNRDGSNIAEYLLSIFKTDREVFNGILETLQYVLPYARDLQPELSSELERTVYLQLTEQEFKIPAWLLSSGTSRILALLAVLRHPHPPPLIVIEELENGLDPRTLNLIVDEIRRVVEEKTTQVIITTHSPYLLDLLHISQIVVVERENGNPKFSRPADSAELKEWSEKFGVGRLYTMEKLNSTGNKK